MRHRKRTREEVKDTNAAQAWNPLDQLTTVRDPKGVATTHTRNAFGEVLSETSPDTDTGTTATTLRANPAP